MKKTLLFLLAFNFLTSAAMASPIEIEASEKFTFVSTDSVITKPDQVDHLDAGASDGHDVHREEDSEPRKSRRSHSKRSKKHIPESIA